MSENQNKLFDVFICHSSKDKAIADAACAVLERNRIRCWIAPRDATPGKEWGDEITLAIERSRVLLVIFSSNADSSQVVRQEVASAISKGLSVLSFRIEDVKPNGALDLHLGNRHWLDAITPPIEKHLEQLARALIVLVGKETADVCIGHETSRLGNQTTTQRLTRSYVAFLFLGVATCVAIAALLLSKPDPTNKSTLGATNSSTGDIKPEAQHVNPGADPPRGNGISNSQSPIVAEDSGVRPERPHPNVDQLPLSNKQQQKFEKGDRVRIRTKIDVDVFQYDDPYSTDESRSAVPYSSVGVVTEVNKIRGKCRVKWDDSSIAELWNSNDNLDHE